MRLTEFLLARIAEDEEAARAAQFNNGQWTHVSTLGAETAVRRDYGPDVVSGHGSLHADDHAHIARHDPARVLVEYEAKRRIVEAVEVDARVAAKDIGYHALRLLAAVYADHPDYRQEWRP